MLTISSGLQRKYGEIYQGCLDKIDILSKKISSTIGNKKKETDNLSVSLEFFKSTFNLYNWKNIILFLSNIEWNDKIEIENNISNILNENTIDAISEIQKLKNIPDKKVYSDFSELLNEVIEELKSRYNSN